MTTQISFLMIVDGIAVKFRALKLIYTYDDSWLNFMASLNLTNLIIPLINISQPAVDDERLQDDIT